MKIAILLHEVKLSKRLIIGKLCKFSEEKVNPLYHAIVISKKWIFHIGSTVQLNEISKTCTVLTGFCNFIHECTLTHEANFLPILPILPINKILTRAEALIKNTLGYQILFRNSP